MDFIFSAIIVLGVIALIAAVGLYAAAKKFYVEEDPRIAQVNEALPGANCGGCGFPGCSAMAEALVKGADNGSIEDLCCPVGGAKVMSQVADLLGMAVAESEPMVAVVRCSGCPEHRPEVAHYDGLRTCAAMNLCSTGESACGYGCLGCGDCVAACSFHAISINPETGLPVVDDSKCVACGACMEVCPRGAIAVWKGSYSVVDDALCIGCGLCARECPASVIRLEARP